MPNARTMKRTFCATQLGLQPGNATVGLWATQLAGGIYSLHKIAALSTSIVSIPIPHAPRGGLPSNEDASISIIEIFYQVTVAGLTSAPTAVLNRKSCPGGTGSGVVANTTFAQSLTFAGLDSVGIAIGSHIAVITPTVPTTLADSEAIVATITMNEAATSVLDIYGITVTYI